MAREKTNSLEVDRECLGECLHAALRKCCDSKPTTLLWNVVGLLDEKVWELYLDHIWVALQVADKTGVKLAEALKEASLSFEDAVSGQKRRDFPSHHFYVFVGTLELLSAEDWQGYAAFLCG